MRLISCIFGFNRTKLCYILPESGHHKPGKKTEKKHKIKYGVINLCSKAYISLEIWQFGKLIWEVASFFSYFRGSHKNYFSSKFRSSFSKFSLSCCLTCCLLTIYLFYLSKLYFSTGWYKSICVQTNAGYSIHSYEQLFICRLFFLLNWWNLCFIVYYC